MTSTLCDYTKELPALADILQSMVATAQSQQTSRAAGVAATRIRLISALDPAATDPRLLIVHAGTLVGAVRGAAAEDEPYEKMMGLGKYTTAEECPHNIAVQWAIHYPVDYDWNTTSALQELHLVVWNIGVLGLLRTLATAKRAAAAGPGAGAAGGISAAQRGEIADACSAFWWCQRLAPSPPQREYLSSDPLHMRFAACAGMEWLSYALYRLALLAGAISFEVEDEDLLQHVARQWDDSTDACAYLDTALYWLRNPGAADDAGSRLIRAVEDLAEWTKAWTAIRRAAKRAVQTTDPSTADEQTTLREIAEACAKLRLAADKATAARVLTVAQRQCHSIVRSSLGRTAMDLYSRALSSWYPDQAAGSAAEDAAAAAASKRQRDRNPRTFSWGMLLQKVQAYAPLPPAPAPALAPAPDPQPPETTTSCS